MRVNQLRQLLEAKMGEEQLEFRVPNIFLPPRFRDLSGGQDLLLVMDDDFTIHIRWHNQDFHEHHPLTPGASRRLVGEVMRYSKLYRENLKMFGKLLCEYAEQPWDEERYNEGLRQEKEATRRAKEDRPGTSGQEEQGVGAVIHGVDELVEILSQGDSPYPGMDY